MLSTWKAIIHETLVSKNFFHASGKRIARTLTYTSPLSEFLTSDLDLNMLGFTKRKMSMLTDYYYHEESVRVALLQLEGRRQAQTYGSAGVTTYNHFAKRERPTHGPCIQSLTFTHIPPGIIHVDVFYRTTEVFKKFAADLIWLNTYILPQFKLPTTGTITFHFANSTFHPMYFSVLIPYLDDPLSYLKNIKILDPPLYKGILRWTWKFAHNDPGLEKFKQGQRVAKHLHRLTTPSELKKLTDHIDKNYTPKKLLPVEEIEDEI